MGVGMTSAQIMHHRLVNQQLIQQSSKNIGDMIAALCALQAQDHAGAKLSVGLRVPGVTDADVEQAIADKSIVRSWSLRGTLHFMHPADIRWILKLVAPRVLNTAAANFRRVGLDSDTFVLSRKIIAKALKGGSQLTREELANKLSEKGIVTEGLRAGFILVEASLNGLICHGPRKGKEFTFVLLEEWLPQGKKYERPEAVAELMQRYFSSHGPATFSDFTYWSGLTVTESKKVLEELKEQLTSVKVNDIEYWMGKGTKHAGAPGSSVILLPGFDELLLGYKDRSAALAAVHTKKVIPFNNGLFQATILIKGEVAGTWKRTFKKDKVVIELTPFTTLSRALKTKVNDAVENYAAFIDLEPEIIYIP